MNHEHFMQVALDLANLGWPAAAPNPLVGCVIVKNEKIVAQAYHERFGGPHAEVNAINNLPEDINPRDCTLYVSLEPCDHQGKTPPCTDLIIRNGFKKVVIASTDPNPLVAGSGIKKLKGAGITVETGILEKKARELNKRFICFHENKRPYIILKWAISADGFISRLPVPAARQDNQITREQARKYVHQLRAEASGIMVGKNTVLTDNPQLTTRLVPGRSPIRIIIDRQNEVPPNFNVFSAGTGTVIFNAKMEEERGHLLFVKLDFGRDIIPQICEKLYQLQVQTLLVEGGATLISSFLNTDCWDEALIFQNPDLTFGTGIKGPEFPLKNSFELVGEDKLFHHFRNETLPAKGPLSKEIF
jgi:diaminohydroxyphosphoribosylaminopyrimidine deaminase/5-amino-6-(5-phosphoribosylamino)uracil reductase